MVADAAAGSDHGRVAVDQRPAAARGRRRAAKTRQDAAGPQPGPPGPGQQSGHGGGEPGAARAVEDVQRVHACTSGRVLIGDERQAGCLLGEPAHRHAEPVQQGQRAGRAARDPHVDREDLADLAVHERVWRVYAAQRARAGRDHHLGSGHRLVGLARRHVERPHHRPGDQQQVRVPGRGGEEEAEPVQVVVGRGEQPDLLLADRARAGVQRADVQAAAELRGDRVPQLPGHLCLVLAGRPGSRASPSTIAPELIAPPPVSGFSLPAPNGPWRRARTPRSR